MEHISETITRAAASNERKRLVPTVSAILGDGSILELVHDAGRMTTAFARWNAGTWSLVLECELPDGRRFVPLSPRNNLVEHGVVKFASVPEEYGTDRELAEAVRAFIRRYVDLSPRFERVATAYVLLSWIADTFNELPYLRVRGEPGSGKTRFLLTVGSLCYKPIFASGASTVSPIFRILDLVKGTLVFDESDFRFSDEKAEMVKILNNGNVRGFSVLRTETVPGSKEFNPRAYHVFGPKLLATRGFFDDAALESRFLTEEMESSGLRGDIPISLPREHDAEAQSLRNRLLLFRFRNFAKPRDLTANLDRSLEPRLAQIFAPLLATVDDAETIADLRDLARASDREMASDRSSGVEADVLSILAEFWRRSTEPRTVSDVANLLNARAAASERPVSTKRVGWLIRKRLRLTTLRSRAGYVVQAPDSETLERLSARYGITASDAPPPASSPSSQRSPGEAPQAV
ncbi:MAG: hypothetical protein HZA52_18850 [Planctomycetes bacterium]|nr:hypothetical protein [Planctomycetota bacterium]